MMAPSIDDINDVYKTPETHLAVLKNILARNPLDPLIPQIAARFEESIGLGATQAGMIPYGEDSIGGAFHVAKLEVLVARENVNVFGYKTVRTIEEARGKKRASAFHRERRGEFEARIQAYPDFSEVLKRGGLNTPLIIAVFNVDEHDGVPPHAGLIMAYEGTEARKLIEEINNRPNDTNAAQVKRCLIETAIEGTAFWRAYPFVDVTQGMAPTFEDYYTRIEAGFSELIRELFGESIFGGQYPNSIASYYLEINGHLIKQEHDMGLRRDGKIHNLGIKVQGTRLTTLDDVIRLTVSPDQLTTMSRIRAGRRDYDPEGRHMLVPLLHDQSQLETDPMLAMTPQEADLNLMSAILNEEMFKAIKDGQRDLATHLARQIDMVFTGNLSPNSDQQMRDYLRNIASKNRPIINFYRVQEEAYAILRTILPRWLVRLQHAEATQNREEYDRMQRQIELQTDNFVEYMKAAKMWHENVRRELGIQGNGKYHALNHAFDALSEKMPMPNERIIAKWDRF